MKRYDQHEKHQSSSRGFEPGEGIRNSLIIAGADAIPAEGAGVSRAPSFDALDIQGIVPAGGDAPAAPRARLTDANPKR